VGDALGASLNSSGHDFNKTIPFPAGLKHSLFAFGKEMRPLSQKTIYLALAYWLMKGFLQFVRLSHAVAILFMKLAVFFRITVLRD